MKRNNSLWAFAAALLLVFFLAFPMEASAADYPYGISDVGQYPYDGGDGTKNDPFLISTPQQLAQLAYDVAQDISYLNQYLKVTADLDLSGLDWQPIGASATQEFMGHFDGNHKIIENLSIGTALVPSSLRLVGLFGYISYAEIHNVKLENASIYISLADDDGCVGALAGHANGTLFHHCSAVGTINTNISSGAYVGGLLGHTDYYTKGIAACFAAVNIEATGSSYSEVGGLVGETYGPIISSGATGNVSGNGAIGGLAGEANGEISDSWATGDVESYHTGGGLIGENSGTIRNCYATGAVFGRDYAGGLVGYNDYYGNIKNSFATGEIDGAAHSTDSGGLVGSTTGNVLNCYAAGKANKGQGLTDYAFPGNFYSPAAVIENCYWNASLNATGGAGIGKTTEEMQSADFAAVLNDTAAAAGDDYRLWRIVPGVNQGMPILDGIGMGAGDPPVVSSAAGSHNLAAAAEISFHSNALGQFYYNVVPTGSGAPDFNTSGSGILCYTGANEYTLPVSSGAWDLYIVVKDAYGALSEPALIELAAEPPLFAGGTGTEADPYQITDAYHLHNVRYFLDGHFIMMADLDLDPDVLDDAFWYDPALGWDPIGSADIYEPAFTGQFDGNGKKVENMTVTFSASPGYSSGNIGLFGCIGTAGAVYDLGIVSCALSSTYYGGGAGGLAGTVNGTVDHCYATGSISVGAINAGGLAGNNYGGSIINSWAAMDIESIGSSYVGGLVGYNDGTIENSGASGNIQGGDGPRAGGFIGYNQSYDNQATVENCYAAGAVSGSGWGFVGPFYGQNQETYSGASFKNCYWNEDAAITATENGGYTPTVHGSTANCLGKDSDYMKSQDFVGTLNDALLGTSGYYKWEIKEGVNGGYPILKDELTEDLLPPAVDDNQITVSSITTSGAVLSWNEATDNITDAQSLLYCVYRSSSNNIGSVAAIEANAAAVGDFGHRSTLTVTGLSANQTYYFNIIVKDEEGNKTAYKSVSLTTAANPLPTYQITATANTGGKVTPPGTSVVTKSNSITYTIQPNPGYLIKDVVVDGVSVGAVNTYTFSAVKANHTIEATFEHDCPGKQFSDVDITQWYHEGIDFVLLAGLFLGTSETKFSPNADMTRAMLVTVLWRIEKEPAASTGNPFADVPANTWYTAAVAWATETGVVQGYNKNTFGSNDPITREQMATILYRYAAIKGYDVAAADSLSQFTDAAKVSSWAADAVKWAVAAGLINGVKATVLDPGGKASRAQVATILMRFIRSNAE